MNLWLKKNWRYKRVTLGSLLGGLFLVVIIWIGLLTLDTPYAIKTASASNHLGILGQQAPELNLDDWISAHGEQTAPIRLSDHRGKVIYLYFFQDW